MLRKLGRRQLPKRRENDSAAFDAANDLLEEMGISYRRVSPDHLKIGDINYYPNTGTITFDGISKAWKEKGLEALVERIEARRRRLNELIAARARKR